MEEIKIKNFLNELRDSSDDMYETFTEGSCFRLCLILKTIFTNTIPYWSEIDGHAISKIDKKYYDIGGELKKEYVKLKEYKRIKDIQGYSLMKYKGKNNQRSVQIIRYEN